MVCMLLSEHIYTYTSTRHTNVIKRERSWLEIERQDVGLLKGWIVISYLNALIGLIEYLYHQDIHSFSEAQL
jgi:hypothetical protein